MDKEWINNKNIPIAPLYSRGYDDNLLKGKTIERAGFVYKSNDVILVIKYTDGTFTAMRSDGDSFKVEYIPTPPSCGDSNGVLGFVMDDKFYYDDYGKILYDMGLYSVDEEVIKERIETREKQIEERQYQEYLRLKAKFEK